MSSGRMAKDSCPGVVEAQVGRCCLDDVTGREADVLKGSRPTAAEVANSPVFNAARDHSLGGEGGAEMPDMRQIITRLPESAMNNEEEGKRSFAGGITKLCELTRIFAVGGSHVVRRWGPF